MRIHLKMSNGKWEHDFYIKTNVATWLDELIKKPKWRKADLNIKNYQYSGNFATLTNRYMKFEIYNLDY